MLLSSVWPSWVVCCCLQSVNVKHQVSFVCVCVCEIDKMFLIIEEYPVSSVLPSLQFYLVRGCYHVQVVLPVTTEASSVT